MELTYNRYGMALLVVIFLVLAGGTLQASAEEDISEIRKAAEQGDVKAQLRLGNLYGEGRGVPKDDKLAVDWYTKAAEQGDETAAGILGFMYGSGDGVPQDDKKAFKWFKKAAEQGDAALQFLLGALYAEGRGVTQDYNEAFQWYRKSAEQGCAKAQMALGTFYYNGKIVLKNDVNAYAWLNLAAAQGEEAAAKFREIIGENLTPEQRGQAQALAVELKAKIDNHTAQTEKAPPFTTASKTQPKSSGTGFVVTADGYVLTCQHVVAEAASVKVNMDDKLYDAQVVKADPSSDLALLKINGSFLPLAFSANRSVKLGQEVFTIGYPNPSIQGVSAKLTRGDINSLTGFQDDMRLYQISVPVQPGNSGGPLIDMDGNVNGVIVAMLDAQATFKISGSLPQNVNYAVKSTFAQGLLDTIPGVSAKLPPPSGKQPFDQAVERVRKSVVMVLVY